MTDIIQGAINICLNYHNNGISLYESPFTIASPLETKSGFALRVKFSYITLSLCKICIILVWMWCKHTSCLFVFSQMPSHTNKQWYTKWSYNYYLVFLSIINSLISIQSNWITFYVFFIGLKSISVKSSFNFPSYSITGMENIFKSENVVSVHFFQEFISIFDK